MNKGDRFAVAGRDGSGCACGWRRSHRPRPNSTLFMSATSGHAMRRIAAAAGATVPRHLAAVVVSVQIDRETAQIDAGGCVYGSTLTSSPCFVPRLRDSVNSTTAGSAERDETEALHRLPVSVVHARTREPLPITPTLCRAPRAHRRTPRLTVNEYARLSLIGASAIRTPHRFCEGICKT